MLPSDSLSNCEWADAQRVPADSFTALPLEAELGGGANVRHGDSRSISVPSPVLKFPRPRFAASTIPFERRPLSAPPAIASEGAEGAPGGNANVPLVSVLRASLLL